MDLVLLHQSTLSQGRTPEPLPASGIVWVGRQTTVHYNRIQTRLQPGVSTYSREPTIPL